MAEEENGAPSPSICKRKKTNEVPTNAKTKRPTRRSATSSNKISEIADDSVCTYGKFCTYDIGPPSWIKREINAYALKQRIVRASTIFQLFIAVNNKSTNFEHDKLIYTRTCHISYGLSFSSDIPYRFY
jgi:hypothetical protein